MPRKKPETPRRSHPIGGMRPRELCHIGKQLYGDGWKDKMAHDFGVNRQTVWRWATGRSTISVPIAIALRSRAPR